MSTTNALTVDQLREALCDLPPPTGSSESVVRRWVTARAPNEDAGPGGDAADGRAPITLMEARVAVEFVRVVGSRGLAWRFVGPVLRPRVPLDLAGAPYPLLLWVFRLLGPRCLRVTGEAEGDAPELVIDVA